jgi:ATP-binding cassette subfamily E protein 1
MFDEPSSYLDVKQRLKAARMIRSMLNPDTYVIVVEHDLSILDYLSDFICCLYGEPGAYGVVTMPMSVRQGINVFLSGFVPSENMRFRDVELNFKVKENNNENITLNESEAAKDNKVIHMYPAMTKTLGPF